jgi:DNA polymerase-3 subunit gamma/tau
MAYQVLARKYRPQRFSDVVGQDHVTRTLGNALEQDRIAHGYIFSGHRGIGKTTIARILAMALNCRRPIGTPEQPNPARPNFEPCGTCESCEEIRAGNAVDVIEIDAATNRGIDEIRELRDAARYRPARDRFKIYILDEAHQITDAAFNALLKTLEEPPDHVIFMMATTQPEDILQTIRSRCQHFSFHAVKFDEILVQLRMIAGAEGVDAEDEALALLAEAGDGSLRDALSIMDQAIASAPLVAGRAALAAAEIRELMGSMPNAVFARLLEQVSENNSGAVLAELDRVLGAGNSPSQVARQCVRYLRNVLMAKIGGEGTELLQISPDERARAAGTALLFGEEELLRFLQVMLRTFDDLNYRQEPRFHLELGVLKLVHLQRLLPVEELMSQLSGTGGAGGLPASSGAGKSVASLPNAGMRTVNAAEAARPIAAGPVTAAKKMEPAVAASAAQAAPAFSPFERDAQRRSIPLQAATSPPVPSPPVPSPPVAMTVTELGKREPMAATAAAVVAPPAMPAGEREREPRVKVADLPLVDEPTQVATQALPLPAETVSALPVEVSMQPQEGALDLEKMREAACSALEAAGHTTAATLLHAGTWKELPGLVQVEVAAKKTMLGLTVNADAEKLIKAAVRPFAGVPPKPIGWVPGEGGAAKTPPRPATAGSVQAIAMENPLVQQAKDLFQAEVRSVVDLRGKR